MSTLRITCFKDFRVELDGKALVNFATQKTQALLAYLAVEGDRPHSRERLAGLLWSDDSEERALHNLRQALSQLRKALGDDGLAIPFILADRDTIQLNPKVGVWLDVNHFSAGLAAAYRYYQRRDCQGWLEIRALKRALDLYQGPFLDQLYMNGSALFDEWAALLREDYNRRAVEALAFLAEYHERRSEYTLARQAVTRITQLAPWDETAHTQLMRLLALDGQWSASQNQYALLRRTLRDQLGVEPARETSELFHSIRQAAASGARLAARFPPARHNLPELLPPFVGREAQLDALSQMIADPECRLLTLVGPGGIGKTRLAVQAAYQQVGIFGQGVFFIPLSAVVSASQLPAAAFNALGLAFGERGDLQTQLVDFLRNKNMLLVWDNFEHLLTQPGSVELLSQIYQSAPGVVQLVTSRERVNLQEEFVYPLEGMDYPDRHELSPEQVKSFDALALFERCASQRHGAFVLAGEALPAAVRICRLLEGLPLGIELAAAALQRLPCVEIAERLSQDLDVLAAAASNTPARHRSLRAAFDVSWQMLAGSEQQVFCRLATFRGGFVAEAAQQVAGATAEILTSLAEKSLLRRSPTGRNDLAEALRPYAAEKLAGDPLADAATNARHADYFAALLTGCTADLKGPGQERALELLQGENENIRRAWRWLVENRCSQQLLRGVESLYHFFNIRSQFAEGIELFQSAVQAYDENPQEAHLSGVLLSRLGAFALRARQHSLAQPALERGREILAHLGETNELAFCLVSLGGLYLRKKDFPTAAACAQESLARFRQSGDGWGEAYALYLAGLIKNYQVELDESKALLEASVAASRQAGDQRRLIAPLNLLGDIACTQGDYAAGERLFIEGLEISRRLNDRFNQGILLNNLASTYQARQAFNQERAVLQESLEICREIGDQAGEAMALNSLGEMQVYRGEYQEALSFFLQALPVVQQVEDDWWVCVCTGNLGEAYCGLGEYALAQDYLLKSHTLAQEIPALDLACRANVNLARVFQRMGKTDQAVKLYQAALANANLEDNYRQKASRWLAECAAKGE